MLGKTHMAVGVASALLVLRPANVTELVLGTGVAAIGAVISDIDIGTSESHQDADRIEMMAAAAALLIAAAELIWHVGIYRRLLIYSSGSRVVTAIAGFLVVCTWGKEQPHRSFMHSLLALAVLTSCVGIFLPMAAPYFAAAFVSHLAIDLLNHRGERLLWPLKHGFSLGLCSSRGRVNRWMFMAGSALSAIEFVALLWMAVR